MENYNFMQLKGVIPAMITCFDADDKLNLQKTRKMARFLVSQGVQGLYITGSTGEAFLMTPYERKKVVEAVLDEVGDEVPIIAHIGDISTCIAKDLAKHAEHAGVDAISSVPPFYFRFSEKEIINYYQEVSESVNVPMIVYNIALAGTVNLQTMKQIISLENVKGIKYALPTHYEIMQLRDFVGKDFRIFCGTDEMAISGLSFGADGLIGATYNLQADLFLRLFDAVQIGNMKEAALLQNIANKIIFSLLGSGSLNSVLKSVLNLMGMDVGFARRPNIHFSLDETQKIKETFLHLKEENSVEGICLFDRI